MLIVLVGFVDSDQLLQVLIVFYILEVSFENYLTLLEQNNWVNKMKEVDCVRDEYSGFLFEFFNENVFEYLFLYVCVKSRYRIIHQVNLLICVDSSR